MMRIFCTAIPIAEAGAWGEPTAAALMSFKLEVIQRGIDGALLGSLKVAAIQALEGQVSQLIGGGLNGRPLFITDYDDFLYQGPAQRADLYMNDFFTLTTRGKSSSSNYVGVGSTDDLQGNYAGYLETVGRQSIQNNIYAVNLDEYTSSPEAMFAEGDWRAFNAFISNPANNPFGYALQARMVHDAELERAQNIAMVEAQSSGFLGARREGKVITPAGSIEATLNNVQDLGNKIIANASHPSEFLSGVVAGVANKMVTNLVQGGVGQAESIIRREYNSVNRPIDQTINNSVRELGPAGPIILDTVQRSSVTTNSVAPAPPSPFQSR